MADIAREAVQRGIVASIARTRIWRWLSADAIRPWFYRSWISPRDPQFAEVAGRVLDLYQGTWEQAPLGPNDYVLCADEKTSIQARCRRSAGPTASGQVRRVESDYERAGAFAYFAAWDVRRAKVFGLCAGATGIEPFHTLVDLVMQQEPYSSADRVFWIADNGSSHRGGAAARRLTGWYPNAILVNTPVHASWLNQVEIYLSVLQRKVLMPNEHPNLEELKRRILSFQTYYEQVAKPFEWKFTRADLNNILARASQHQIPEADKAA